MKIAFRVDSSASIGSGHLMRCLTLAEALKSEGAQSHFFAANHPGNFNQLIKNANHTLHILPAEDELDPEPCLLQNFDLFIVDHYKLASSFESSLKQSKVMVIDDLANRAHDCDLLLDQNLLPNYQTRYDSLLPARCRKLLGPEYLLLREEFSQLRDKGLRSRNQLKQILIFFGGSDQDQLTLIATKAVLANQDLGLSCDIVVGANYPDIKSLEQLCIDHQNLKLHVQTKQIAQLMHDSDLAIGAGGSANWERCYLGLPSILVTVADNQIATTKELERLGGCIYLGDKKSLNQGQITKTLRHLVANSNILTSMAEKSAELIPHRAGTKKVVAVIKELLSTNKHEH